MTPIAKTISKTSWTADLGGKLRALRLAHKVKQIDLARTLGISPAYLNLIESNKRPLQVELLQRILEFFEIDMEAFRASSEDARLQDRFEEILKDPFLQGHALGNAEIRSLAENPALSNLLLSVYEGFKNAQAALQRVEGKLFTEEEDREDRGQLSESFSILDRTAYDEVTEFLEHHRNHFPEIEERAEGLLGEAGADHARRRIVLGGILKRRFGIEVVERRFPLGSGVLRLYNEKKKRLYVSDSMGTHRQHFQIAHFIGLMSFEDDAWIDELLNIYGFRRRDAPVLARVNLANYFAGALLLPYEPFLKLVEETAYDVRAMEGYASMPFEAVAHRLCTMNRPGASGIPLHFLRTDIAGNITKKYSGSGLRIDDRRRSCSRWAVHNAFLTPSVLRRQYSIMPSGEAYFCMALATVQHDPVSPANTHAYSVGLGCRAEDASHLAPARGLRFEHPERDAVKIGINCRVCDRADCAQRALPSFKMDYEINTTNRKENVLSPLLAEDLLLAGDDGSATRD